MTHPAFFVSVLIVGWSLVGQPVACLRAELTVEEAYDALRVEQPTAPDDVTFEALRKVGGLGTLQSAYALIAALAFNRESHQMGQEVPQVPGNVLFEATFVPAIATLRRHYGSLVLPLLFMRGIATDESWMRERCALAVRIIASRSEIDDLRRVFSLDSTTHPAAKAFDQLLLAENLEIYTPQREAGRVAARTFIAALRKLGEGQGRRQDVPNTTYLNRIIEDDQGEGRVPEKSDRLRIRYAVEVSNHEGFPPIGGQSLTFILGAGEVGAAIETAVGDMREGGRRVVSMREEVAGGIREAWEDLPAESILVVTIELLDVSSD